MKKTLIILVVFIGIVVIGISCKKDNAAQKECENKYHQDSTYTWTNGKCVAIFTGTNIELIDKTVFVGKDGVEAIAEEVRNLAALPDTKNIIVKSQKDFQEMEETAMTKFTNDLQKLFNEVKQCEGQDTINPKSINSADSLALTVLKYLVRPVGQTIEPDPCAGIRNQVEKLIQDTTIQAKNMRGAVDPAIKTGPDGNISDYFNGAAEVWTGPTNNLLDSAKMTIAAIEQLWFLYGNPLPLNGANIQKLYDACKLFIKTCEDLFIAEEQLSKCETEHPTKSAKRR